MLVIFSFTLHFGGAMQGTILLTGEPQPNEENAELLLSTRPAAADAFAAAVSSTISSS